MATGGIDDGMPVYGTCDPILENLTSPKTYYVAAF